MRAWSGLHPKQQGHAPRGTRRPRPIARGALVLVEVAKPPQRTREPRTLWLWRRGPGEPDLDLPWRAYTRRLDLEHTSRLPKRTSGRTTPRVRRPEAGEPTPCRARRAVSALLLALGAPASAPKPCGRSPGRPKGGRSGRARRYPALKKAA